MKRLVMGILAHVDAGKTTLSEGLLYSSGSIRSLGRVDHKSAFLDTYELERERGITIFSKQAILNLNNTEIILMDTPGHVDFSSEMERTLQVLDYAVLVISGTDGVQGHTQTLWRLLKKYDIPTFIFVNKMDLAGADKPAILAELSSILDSGCIDFSAHDADFFEAVAMCDESALTSFLEGGNVSDSLLRDLISQRKLFPCLFGSALKLEGIEQLISLLEAYTQEPSYPPEFGARVYKIGRDAQGARLTYMKLTGGSLRVKELLSLRDSEGAEQTEKVNQIRIYSGAKFVSVPEVTAGQICAVSGLISSYSGQGLGIEAREFAPILSPVMTYQAIIPPELNAFTALSHFRQLEDEDPQLHVVWHEQTKELHLQLMGVVQLDILKQQLLERFGANIEFGQGSIIYRETLAAPSIGMGHFEPLRHYAEVQLLIEPTTAGSGLSFATTCSEELLGRNWQHLVLTHMQETAHPGVLTGSPLTDVKITLLAGRAHQKHTEGGDFRQATYRAIQHGLKCGESLLLEPWYDFRMILPSENVGRAMTDIQQMGGEFSPPEAEGELRVLKGSAPVSLLGGYGAEFATYTHGMGRISFTPGGYKPCHNTEEVVAQIGYDSENNPYFSADSVFCNHGSGFAVKWNIAHLYMHISLDTRSESAPAPVAATPTKKRESTSSLAQDKELLAIFESVYGPVKQRQFRPVEREVIRADSGHVTVNIQEPMTEYLLVDGYNVLFSWTELSELAQENMDAARKRLMDMLSNYQSMRGCELILVFDAYKVIGGREHEERYHNITVVYTKQAETADTYIEKASYKLAKRYRVRVVTSDYIEQLIILGHGALRVSASAFYDELIETERRMQAELCSHNRTEPSRNVETAMREAMRETEK